MKKKNQFSRSILLLLVMMFAQTALLAQTATPPTGAGTEGSPYLIANLNNLYWITQNSAAWDKYYQQTADIDASSTSTWDDGKGFSPIGTNINQFKGHYDGQGFSISGLTINRVTSNIGLFGMTNDATIKNITLAAVNIKGNESIGALVGFIIGSTNLIDNCHASGSIVAVSSSAVSRAGGLIGAHFGIDANKIINSSSSCIVSSNARYVGGLVGSNQGIIDKSYATGEVICTSTSLMYFFGGFTGDNAFGKITDCYSTGSINSNEPVEYVGGFIGENNNGTVKNCYSIGKIINPGTKDIGGFIGVKTGSTPVTNCFWDKETSGQNTSAAGTAKTTAEMKTKSTFTDASWDFSSIWAISNIYNNGYPNLDHISPPNGSGTSGDPYLIATINDLEWLSKNPGEWENKHYKQTADIDASSTSTWDSGKGFSPIGNFTGQYDGQHFTISGLVIKRTYSGNQAMFGSTTNAIIKNIKLTAISIEGAGNTAMLVGKTEGTTLIDNCHVAGSVKGGGFGNDNGIGGLVGTHNGGTISNSSSAADVSGVSNRVGGFVGENFALVENCYSTGNIAFTGELVWEFDYKRYYGGFIGRNVKEGGKTGVVSNCYSTGNIDCKFGANEAGGFMGYNDKGTVSNCYSTGSIIDPHPGGDWVYPKYGGFMGVNYYSSGTGVTNCFWDTETSGQGSSEGGTGKTTAEMKTKSTFTDYDFNTIWAMSASSNSGYPNLDGIGSSITWSGSVSNNWYDAGNWVGGITPSGTDDVIIAAGSNSPVVVGIYCNNLTINNAAELTVQTEGSLITYGTITNNGTINILKAIGDDDKWHFIAAPNNITTATKFSGMYLQKWDEPENLWFDITDAAESLTPMKGYSLWSPASAKGSFSFTGTPNTGDQSIAISSAGGGTSKGTNLLGNPYPSFVDWDLVSGYGAKYTWNGTSYDSRTEAGDGSGSRYLSPMEGFFIYTASAGTFNLTNSQRTHIAAGKSAKTLEKGLVLSATSGENENLFHLIFDATASENFELAEDAWKLLSGTSGLAEIYSISTDGRLAVDVRPETESVQLGFVNDKAGVYSIAISEIAELAQVHLEDTKTNTYHNLKNGAYEFVWETSDSETRFKLHFNAVGIDEDVTTGNSIKIYAQGKTLFVNSRTKQQAQLGISDMSGRTMHTQAIVADGLLSIPTNLAAGVYLVTVKSKSGGSVQKVIVQ